MLARLRSLWRNLRHGAAVDQDLDAELEATRDLLIDEKIAAGVDPLEARRRATMELAGIEPIKERVRDIRTGVALDTLWQDVKHAARHFRRSPGFAAAAILTLALGIGANTAMFTLLNAIVLERLPIPDADDLMAIAPVNSRGLPRSLPMSAVGQLRDGPLEHLCAYMGGVVLPVLANHQPVQTLTTFVTADCFAAFGIDPILGRGIVEAEAPIHGAGAHIALITYRLWMSAYNGDAGVIGSSMLVNNVPVTIVGVLPRGFIGLEVDTGIDIFTPFDAVMPAARGRRQLASYLLGRLRPGVTREAALAQIEAGWPSMLEAVVPAGVAPTERAQLLDSQPKLVSFGTGVSRLRDRYSQPLTLIFGLTTLLLVLACVNLGGLLLSRANARSAELAIRLALGGSRARIAQQMLVEGVLLSLCGAALAVPIAYATAATLASFVPPINVPYTIAIAPNRATLAITTVIAIVVGMMMSAVPIWVAASRGTALQIRWDRTVAGGSSLWGRGLLAVQIALAVVMLIDATLLARSLYVLLNRDLGIRTNNILTIKMWTLPNAPFARDGHETYYPALLEQVRALPGVKTAAIALSSPRLANAGAGSPVAWQGDAYGNVTTTLDLVSPGYFSTMGIRVLAGRDASWQDTPSSAKVAIISESLARALSSDGNVLGRGIRIRTMPTDLEYTVVGVVSDATMGDPHESRPRVVYRPLLQKSAGTSLNPNLVIETTDTASAASGVREILREGGRDYALEIIKLDDLLARAPATERMSATVAIAVGSIGILLALIGVHGILAYSVSRRTREIGVRIAVGAVPLMAAATVLREAALVCGAGLLLGLPIAAISARSLRSLMFGVSESDPLTFAAAAAAFLLVTLLAAAIPARRAAAVDPVIALRGD